MPARAPTGAGTGGRDLIGSQSLAQSLLQKFFRGTLPVFAMATITIQQAYDIALQHHRAGRLPQAEKIYRQIIAQHPDHPEAMHHLGVIAYQVGQHEMSIELIRRAIALKPGLPDAHNNLANALRSAGRIEESIVHCRQAIALKPDYAEAHNNLGIALNETRQFDEAIAAYQRAIALRPGFPEVYNNLGNALAGEGRLDDAIAAYRQAIALKDDYAEAHSNLGVALFDKREVDGAMVEYERAIALRPNYAEAHYNLGNALREKGKFNEAVAAHRQAIALRPDYAEAYNNLGVALNDLRKIDEAISAYRMAIGIKPNYAEAYNNLGVALNDRGELDEAIDVFRKAIAFSPKHAKAHNNLASALKDQGNLDEAIALFNNALKHHPDDHTLRSNFIYTLHFHPDYDAPAILREHLEWDRRHGQPLAAEILPHRNDRSPDRRLRIGYLSPNYRYHPVGRFLLPLLQHHDRRNVEVFCYSDTVIEHFFTDQLRAAADVWRDSSQLSDDKLIEQIRRDQIDILVDLTLHMAHGRTLVFARKPAPVQVTYLGYCSTTGLKAIDYRLTDRYLDPEGFVEGLGQVDEHYSEKSIRLPETYWCYQPGIATPEVNPLPAAGNNFITFGSLNNFGKVTPRVLEVWCAIMAAVPNSRLHLHTREGAHRKRITEFFAQHNIDPKRVDFIGFMTSEQYFSAYQKIDIALDPFPCAGGTTSCDALWMGVPVVSLAGRTSVGRAGTSILSNVGLPDLIAKNPDEYVELATSLANNVPRLANLRAGLRHRMQTSPLMNGPKFAGNVETAYRRMWREWCTSSAGKL